MSMAFSSGFGPAAIVNAPVAWDTSQVCDSSRSAGIVGRPLEYGDPLGDPCGVLVGKAHDRELQLQQLGGALLGSRVAKQAVGHRAPRQHDAAKHQHEQRPRKGGKVAHQDAVSPRNPVQRRHCIGCPLGFPAPAAGLESTATPRSVGVRMAAALEVPAGLLGREPHRGARALRLLRHLLRVRHLHGARSAIPATSSGSSRASSCSSPT